MKDSLGAWTRAGLGGPVKPGHDSSTTRRDVHYDIELNSAAHYPVRGIVELSPLIEQAGFGAFWKGESNSTDPFVLISAIAARTSKLKLGTAIYHIYGRSAVTLGIQSATLQDLSDGRLLLGLGVANKTIAAWHNGVFDRPLRRAREYIDIVKRRPRVSASNMKVRSTTRKALPILVAALLSAVPDLSRGSGSADDQARRQNLRRRVHQYGNARDDQGHRAPRAPGAMEAGRDPDALEIIAKVRVAQSGPDNRPFETEAGPDFYNIADHYKDMLIASGFEPEVTLIQEAFKAGGFKAAAQHMTDDYMDKLPVIPGTSIKEIKERLEPFREAGVTRLVVPYVPVTEPVIDDARAFVEAWGNS